MYTLWNIDCFFMDWYLESQRWQLGQRYSSLIRCNLESKHEWDVKSWRDLVYHTHFLKMREVLLVDVFWVGPFESESAFAERLTPSVTYVDEYRQYRLQRVGLRGFAWSGPYVRWFWHLDFFGAIWCWIWV